MKKILILFFGVTLTWNVVFAQAPTLNWRIHNPRIEQISSSGIKSFLCFDLQVSATTAGTYFDGLQAVITFNTAGLDGSNTTNRKVIRGPLATGSDGDGNLFYNITTNWIPATNRLFLGVSSDILFQGQPGSSDIMNEVTTSYQTLLTVKLYITNKNLIANLIYVQASMNGFSTYRDDAGVTQYYTFPYNYGTHDLANAYLGRIHSTFNGWSQAGNTVAGTGWTNWTLTENTTVWDGNGHITTTDALVTGLYVDPSAIITVDPGKSLTASGNTYINDIHGLVIASTAAGTGSFRDNGTIAYGASGSADVQTYITNVAAPGSFYAHLVGPTVNDPIFEGVMGYKGVYLQNFNMAANTYAYSYNETGNTWLNLVPVLTPVKTAKGIMLSTVVPGSNTMTMSGRLVTGAVSSATLQHGTNNFDLLSNPYASALDFDLFYAANANILNNCQIWDPSAGAYKYYITTGGGNMPKDVQVGQGFFVQTQSASPAQFNNTMRVHSTAPFLKDAYATQLRLNLTGNGYEDATFIHFKSEGTWSFDVMHDLGKWTSMLAEAAEIWTRDSDESMLCMNALPSLESKTVSVPLDFKCGAADSYTITAENISSFEAGTEIYLEDLVTGAAWYNLIQNPVYEFAGNPEDNQNRFIIHFFGPTGINDPDASGLVTIYGYGQDAYIVNRGKETIKEYVAYDMMGRELHRGSLPNNTVNKVQIGDVSAYYIVKVITKEGRIYTDKVYINK